MGGTLSASARSVCTSTGTSTDTGTDTGTGSCNFDFSWSRHGSATGGPGNRSQSDFDNVPHAAACSAGDGGRAAGRRA